MWEQGHYRNGWSVRFSESSFCYLTSSLLHYLHRHRHTSINSFPPLPCPGQLFVGPVNVYSTVTLLLTVQSSFISIGWCAMNVDIYWDTVDLVSFITIGYTLPWQLTDCGCTRPWFMWSNHFRAPSCIAQVWVLVRWGLHEHTASVRHYNNTPLKRCLADVFITRA